MNIEDNPYIAAMSALHEVAIEDIAMLRSAFIIDGIRSGRHTQDTMADLLEAAAEGFKTYGTSPTRLMVDQLRDGKMPPPVLRVIEGGKAKE